jgi:hypothetical protein
MWIDVFYIVMPRSILGGYQCFGGTCHLSLRVEVSIPSR